MRLVLVFVCAASTGSNGGAKAVGDAGGAVVPVAVLKGLLPHGRHLSNGKLKEPFLTGLLRARCYMCVLCQLSAVTAVLMQQSCGVGQPDLDALDDEGVNGGEGGARARYMCVRERSVGRMR